MKKALVCLAVIGIIILAIGLRIWGIGWGLPTASHYYSYHPDENVVLGASRNIDLFNGQFDPKFYNYGSLYIYIVNIAVVTGAVSGYINLDTKDSASVIAGLSHMYLAGRLAALLLGVLTVYLVFLLGRRASGDRRVGLLAALLFAIVPLHVNAFQIPRRGCAGDLLCDSYAHIRLTHISGRPSITGLCAGWPLCRACGGH